MPACIDNKRFTNNEIFFQPILYVSLFRFIDTKYVTWQTVPRICLVLKRIAMYDEAYMVNTSIDLGK